MDLNIFVKNVYILLSPAYKNITFYGSSHKILTNWLINVDNFVQKQSALLVILNIQICKYICIPLIYIFFNKKVGRGNYHIVYTSCTIDHIRLTRLFIKIDFI